MAKARAIVKRRRAVRNIRKITRTMQMIATAKFQKSLKRSVGTKPYTLKIRELVRELAASVGNVEHPLLRKPGGEDVSNRTAVVVLTGNRGLAGAYNGNVLRTATGVIRQQESAGRAVDLYVSGKKGINFFNFQKRPMTARFEHLTDDPHYSDVEKLAEQFIEQFSHRQIDAVHVVYMNFISTGVQRPDSLTLLPLAGVDEAVDHIALQLAEKEAQMKAGMLDTTHRGTGVQVEQQQIDVETVYDFSPEPKVLLDELLPLTVKTAFFQCFLDATTSEHVARMVAMKSASDNAEKMAKSLTMQYNRARQTQITTELSEIMGGVEAMRGA